MYSKPYTHTRDVASRIPDHYQAFICEDKLDKWLDLESAHLTQLKLKKSDDWRIVRKYHIGKSLNKESTFMFEKYGITPKMIADATLTPLVIPRIHQILFNQTSAKCHAGDKQFRRLLDLTQRASLLSFDHQFSHLIENVEGIVTQAMNSGVEKFRQKFLKWPKEATVYFAAMEDMLHILQVRKQLRVPIKSRSVGKRGIEKVILTDEDQAKTKKLKTQFYVPSLSGTITMTSSLCTLKMDGAHYVIPDELLLEICNKVCEMFCALISSHFLSGNAHSETFYVSSVKFWKTLIKMMLSGGEKGLTGVSPEKDNQPFTILKTIEGLGVASVMYKEDMNEGWENEDLMNSMWKSLIVERLVPNIPFSDHELGRLFLKMSSPDITELIGTVKLFGHPAIELRAGVKQLYDRTHSEIKVDPYVVRQTQGVLTRDLTRGYLNNHKRLPQVEEVDPEKCPHLYKVFVEDFSMANPKHRENWYLATAIEWSQIKFKKNQEFDNIENQLRIIKDKALGVTKSEVVKLLAYNACGVEELDDYWNPIWIKDLENIEKFVQCTKKTEKQARLLLAELEEEAMIALENGDDVESTLESFYEKTAKVAIKHNIILKKHQIHPELKRKHTKRAERRTLLMYLMTPEFDTNFRKYFTNYQAEKQWTNKVLDHLVIKLTAKELEMKTHGRYFGASPPYERNRRVVQEQNVMNLMHMYLPDQLMTPNELQIMKKLVSFRYFNKLFPGHVLFQVSFDFSKWNNNMRAASIDVPAAMVLDPWFNTNLYGRTMEAFEHMCVYLNEETVKTGWQGQQGGIEGLNQATWSTIFLAGVKNALEGAGLKYQLTVKGDDVRAVIAVPVDDLEHMGGYEKARDTILERIQHLCKAMGWQLNPNESFVSITLIATSKQYQVRETWLPACLKKSMKIMNLSNILLPTFEDLIGSIFSTAHSACSQSTVVIPLFSVALITACSEIYRSLPSNKRLEEVISFMTMWPQVLGGPGALPLQTFFVRGENDMLSVGIALLKHIIQTSSSANMRTYALNVFSQKIDNNPDESLLLMDPYSIPLLVPQRPASILKKKIQKRLQRWVKNRDIKTLLSTKGLRERDNFVKHLTSMRPYLGKVATAVFECSPYYLLDELLAKFMESPTVVALFTGDKSIPRSLRLEPTLKDVMDAARKRMEYWISIIFMHPVNQHVMCGLTKDDFMSDVCPTRITRIIRNLSWNREIHGVTYPSLTTQLSIGEMSHIVYRTHWDLSSAYIGVVIRANESKPQTDDDSQHYSAAEGQIPWVGSVTESKIKFPHLVTHVKTPTLTKLEKLLVLRLAMSQLGHEIMKTIEQVIQSLTTVPLSDLDKFQLSGEVGHFTHRLAIHSFSMETMPNYRTNFLQMLNITTDNLGILKQDTRDRTINFAAINFYLGAICLLPLQFERCMPPNFPTQLVAIFHPESWDSGEYLMCDSCCCIEEDKANLQFDYSLMTDMTRYATLRLVGTSDYEQQILKQGLAEFLAEKLVRDVIRLNRDPYDSVVLKNAAMILVTELAQSSISHSVQAAVENYFSLPDQQIMSMYAAYTGAADPLNISVSLLRSVPPKLLYLGALAALVSHFIDRLFLSNEVVVWSVLQALVSGNNPLSEFFNNLLRADLIPSLVQGSLEANLLAVPLNFTAGMSTGSACAAQFMIQHIPKIREWVENREDMPICKIYTKWESSQVKFKNDALTSYHKRVVWACRSYLGKRLEAPFHRMIADEFTRLIKFEFHQQTGEELDIENLDMIPENIELLIRAAVATWNTMINRRGNIITPLRYLHKLPLVTSWMRVFPLGDWEDVDDDNLPELREYNVVGAIQVRFVDPEIFTFNDYRMQEEIFKKIFPLWHPKLIYPICKVSLMWCSGVLNDFQFDIIDRWYDAVENMDRMLQCVNVIEICYMTLEESARVLRQNTDNQNELRSARILYLRTLERVRREHYEAFRHHHTERMLCRLNHPSRDLVIPMRDTPTPSPLNRQGLSTLTPNAVTPTVHTPQHSIYCDQQEVTRVVGRHNTSLAKYAQLFVDLDLFQVILHPNNPRPKLTLADGLGGVTAFVAWKCPNSYVFFNSLRYDRKTGRAPADMSRPGIPIEVVDPFFDKETAHRIRTGGTPTGDLTDIETQNSIIQYFERTGENPDLITFDADINWDAPLIEYHDLIFGALRIACTLLSQDTTCIFKTFLMNNWVVQKFLLVIRGCFQHVHITRSPCTRNYSLEILVVFSKPTNISEISRLANIYLGDPHIGPSLNLTVENLIRREVCPIINKINTFRSTGLVIQSEEDKNLINIYAGFTQCKTYILPVDVVLSFFNVSYLNFNLMDTNNIERYIAAIECNVNEWLDYHSCVGPNMLTAREMAEVQHLNHNRIPIRFMGQRRGYQRRKYSVIRLVKLYTLRRLGSQVLMMQCGIPNEMFRGLIMILLEELTVGLCRVGLGSKFSYIIRDHQLIIKDYKYELNVSQLIRQCYHKILQLLGIMYYSSYIIRYSVETIETRNWLKSGSPYFVWDLLIADGWLRSMEEHQNILPIGVGVTMTEQAVHDIVQDLINGNHIPGPLNIYFDGEVPECHYNEIPDEALDRDIELQGVGDQRRDYSDDL